MEGELSMNESIPKIETGVSPAEEAEAYTPDYIPKPDEFDEVECEDLDLEDL
jgi:hypothetical protein